MQTPELLDCGHLSQPQDWGNGSGLPGYASDRNSKRRICYDCADNEQRNDLKTHDRYVAYLTSTAEGPMLTTWPGGKLATITRIWDSAIGGFMGRTLIKRFQAIDVHGNRWYGTSPGFCMYARMRRSKSRAA